MASKAQQTGPPAHIDDIAKEAYTDALCYLKDEFVDDAEALLWISSIGSTSIDDLRETAVQAERKYREKAQRQQGVMKWVGSLSRTVMHYSSAFDVLTQHHPELTSLVWGITKFILMGVINHGNLVDQLSQALGMIASVLPRTKITAELYKTSEMKGALSSLYAHVILFLKQALKWYRVGPAKRALGAIFKPFELAYKNTLQEIERCAQTIDRIASLSAKLEVREIRDASSQHTTQLVRIEDRLHLMQRQFDVALASLNNELVTVRQHVCYSRSKIDHIHTDINTDMGEIKPRIFDMHFKDMLDVLKPNTSPEQALQSHRSLIRRAMPKPSQHTEDARALRAISNWTQRPRAPFLVLQAEARAQARVKRLAVEVIERLKPQQQQVVWYLSSTAADEASRASTTEVLRTLVGQMMAMAPQIVSDSPDSFNVRKLSASHSDEEWLQLLCWLLERLPACFVVIEAEDVMRNEGDSGGLMTILRTLSSQLSEKGLGVKLLVVNYRRSQNLQQLKGLEAATLNIRGEVPGAVLRNRRMAAVPRARGRI